MPTKKHAHTHYLTPQERRVQIKARQAQAAAEAQTRYARQAKVARPKPLTLFNLLGDAILRLTFENLQLRRIGHYVHNRKK